MGNDKVSQASHRDTTEFSRSTDKEVNSESERRRSSTTEPDSRPEKHPAWETRNRPKGRKLVSAAIHSGASSVLDNGNNDDDELC